MKRFDFDIRDGMEEYEEGEYVRFADHQTALDEVLTEAVWAMEGISRFHLADAVKARIAKFLSSPLVAAYRRRQKNSEKGA